jgi:hypothetical protein
MFQQRIHVRADYGSGLVPIVTGYQQLVIIRESMPDSCDNCEADRSGIKLLRCSRTSDPTAILTAGMLGNFLRLGSRGAWKMHANLPGKLRDETLIDLRRPSATAITLAFSPFGVFETLGLRLFDGLRLD